MVIVLFCSLMQKFYEQTLKSGIMSYKNLEVLNCGSFNLFSTFVIGVIYASYISANLFMGGASPLFFEMACEVTYPVAEGVTTLVLTLVNNIAGLLFLLVQLLPIGEQGEVEPYTFVDSNA